MDYRIIGNMGEYNAVIVKGDTGAPHIHIINEETGFDCSIELFNAKYMPDTKNILTDQELEYFNNWIRLFPNTPNGRCHWEIAKRYWYALSEGFDVIHIHASIPEDYTKTTF